MKKVIAIDLGASNGRLIVAKLQDQKLLLEEIHRFPNEPLTKGKHLFWDISHLLNEIKSGLCKYVQKYGATVDGIGIDTWGVDFGFISSDDRLLDHPYSYRDTHTSEIMNEVHQKITPEELFNQTGVEPAPINTIYQLAAIIDKRPELSEKVSEIITMPSLIGFLMTGQKYNEFTHASTTQLLSLKDQNWDPLLMETVFSQQLPMAEIKETNIIVGQTSDQLNQDTGLNPTSVINVPGHDTACALAAMPLQSKDTIFMSCGTWVLIGIEVKKPVVSKQAYEWGFTNEGTVDRTYRLQKNNMGLWLLQQCKKEWEEAGEVISYQEESELMMQVEPFQSFIDPDNQMFFNPDSMIKAIQEFCKKTNQTVPSTKGEFIRCIIESLALKYRWILERIEKLTEQKAPSIHMVGGGIQNTLLCQFTANATQKEVHAGPIEASAIGNALSQFMALKEINDLDEARDVSRYSFDIKKYSPQDINLWEEAYSRFIDGVGLHQ